MKSIFIIFIFGLNVIESYHSLKTYSRSLLPSTRHGFQIRKSFLQESTDSITDLDWSPIENSKRMDRPVQGKTIQELLQKSDFYGFQQLMIHILWLGFCFWINLTTKLVYFKIFFSILQGFALVTLGHCAQHECIHYTAFKTKILNDVVAYIVSIPRLTNPSHEAMLHKQHHIYTNNPDYDPELTGSSPRNKIPITFDAYVKNILRLGSGKFGLGVWSSRIAILINSAMGNLVGYTGYDPLSEVTYRYDFNRLHTQASTQLQLFIYLLFTIIIFRTKSELFMLQYWLLPILIGEPLHAIFHIADHINCSHDHKDGIANTRTTLAPWFIKCQLWNMNYHAEHHLYPAVPFHQLPRLHNELSKQGQGKFFKNISESVIALHKDIIKTWIPYIQNRKLSLGINHIENNWIPATA